jgi:hypothetical protein
MMKRQSIFVLASLTLAIMFSPSNAAIFQDSGVSNSGREAIVWTEDSGMVGLGDLPGGSFYIASFDMSSDGSTVAGTGQKNRANEAFTGWDEAESMRILRDVLVDDYALDLTGWSYLDRATGISADDLTIIGTGIHNGNQEAWRAKISEEPTFEGVGDLSGVRQIEPMKHSSGMRRKVCVFWRMFW